MPISKHILESYFLTKIIYMCVCVCISWYDTPKFKFFHYVEKGKTKQNKKLTVNSLLKNAFSWGIFSIFPGPTLLLIHCKENKIVIHIFSQILREKKNSRNKKVSFLFYVTLYPKNQYTDMIYWSKNIILTLTFVLVLHSSFSLYIASSSVLATNPKTGKYSKALKSM